MHGRHPLLLLLLSSIWILSLSSSSNVVGAWRVGQPGVTRAHSFLTEHPQRQRGDRALLTKVRDGIIDLLWNVPTRKRTNQSRWNAPIVTTDAPSPQKLTTRYSDDIVLRFNFGSAKDAQSLADASKVLFLDVWEFNANWADIRVAKDVVPSLLGLLPASLTHSHTPLMHDLAQAVYETYPAQSTHPDQTSLLPRGRRTFSPSLQQSSNQTDVFFQNYQPLSVIVPWMRLLASMFPTHVRLVEVGASYEGRPIWALRVGVHPTNVDKPLGPRKSILVSGGSHAREWVSTSTVNFIAYTLITSYGKSSWTTKLLEEFDWIFVPTLNPDGYVYTWETDRLWRKNRQPTNLRFCKGLDLDRTYGFQWDGEASESNPCSESFSGDGPFQGIESNAFARWAKNETESGNAKFVGFLDLHSYSQQILYPFSYSCNVEPPSLEDLEELGFGLAKAIHKVNGEFYGVTSACEGSVTEKLPFSFFSRRSSSDAKEKDFERNRNVWPRMENSGGSALDWFYHELHVRHAFQLKLRDTGSYGFLLPPKLIVPTGKEAFDAVLHLGQYLMADSIADELDELLVDEPPWFGGSDMLQQQTKCNSDLELTSYLYEDGGSKDDPPLEEEKIFKGKQEAECQLILQAQR